MLTIENIHKTYQNKLALKDVSITIPKGSCFGLVGPNGAGKSTLMKIIASVIRQDGGNILISNVSKVKMDKRQLGYIPQEICVEESLTALQNLFFWGKLYGLRGGELHDQAMKVLKDIGLVKQRKQKVNTFSGGMKRRLNIGCALMHDPHIIIMDEPTVGIDPQSRLYIYNMIHTLKQKGCTIIYASHYMEEVERLCDAIALMDKGEIVEAGMIHTILDKYTKKAVLVKSASFIPGNLDEYVTVDGEKNMYQYPTDTPLETMKQIIEYSLDNNYALEKLELKTTTLEDVFFSLTGSHLRD